MEDFKVRPEVLSRIKAALNGQSYRDVIESSSTYNNGIVSERKLRLPYLDSQTGVAQSDCCLWMRKSDRRPGQSFGQLYSYPAKTWRKKRRQYLMNDNYLSRQQSISRLPSTATETSGTNNTGGVNDAAASSSTPSKTEAPTAAATASVAESSTTSSAIKAENNNSDSTDKFSYDNSKEGWYGDFEDGSDMPDAGELDDPESDFDDYEEYASSKKKKKKKSDTPAKRKRVEYSDAEKPYSCELCGARYKTRPGLSYHYSHSHQNDGGGGGDGMGGRLPEEGGEGGVPPFAAPRPMHANPNGGASSSSQGLVPPQHPGAGPGGMALHGMMPPQLTGAPQMPLLAGGPPGGHIHNRSSPIPQMPSAAGQPPPPRERPDEESFEGNRPAGKPIARPSIYCDFCLGDEGENKKTKSAESLVSCSDCGRSAHPTCLQFTPNMITSVKKYRWQCIECKSCGLCGTSDNDVSVTILISQCYIMAC